MSYELPDDWWIEESGESLILEQDKVRAEVERMLAALSSIYALVHVPTPRGTSAYTHFMRDFDAIRKIARPFVVDGQSTRERE
jgi:hypothetical protein